MTYLSAAATSASVSSTKVSAPELLLQLVLGLGLVLVLVAVAARVLRRRGNGIALRVQRRDSTIRVLGRQPMGRGVSVAVVQVGERAYLIGITPTTIHPLGDADVKCLSSNDSDALRDGTGIGRTKSLVTWTSGKTSSTSGDGLVLGKGYRSQRSASTWTQAIDNLRELTLRRG